MVTEPGPVYSWFHIVGEGESRRVKQHCLPKRNGHAAVILFVRCCFFVITFIVGCFTQPSDPVQDTVTTELSSPRTASTLLTVGCYQRELKTATGVTSGIDN